MTYEVYLYTIHRHPDIDIGTDIERAQQYNHKRSAMDKIKVVRSYKTYEPVSMLPARGWRAVFAYDDERRYAHAGTMVALVITKIRCVDVYENGHKAINEEMRIMGYTASDIGIHPAEESHNFMGYLAPGTVIPNHMEQRAEEYVLANETAKE